MIDCPDDLKLERLLADQLDGQEEAVLESHVASCPACQARLDQLTGGPAPSGLRGDYPRHSDSPHSSGVLRRVAELPVEQLKMLEQEFVWDRAPGMDSGPRFTVMGLHAEGGLGRVHLATDRQLHRTVALKEIRPDRASDARLRRRFLNEAEITGQLEHPGIVPIYALEYDDAGRPSYAMRFIKGRTLSDAIESHHRQPTALGLRELLQRFISVCQTVAYAHSRGVIHRDLKPNNVMLGDYGETLVVDWGLAKRLAADDSFTLAEDVPATTVRSETQTASGPDTVLDALPAGADGRHVPLTMVGQVMGTPAYMAPEQALGEPLTVSADIYALGGILFTILSRKVPFEGSTTEEVLRKAAAGEPPAIAGAPRSLNAVASKAMARNQQSRYASALDLAHDLERWLADEPVQAYREPRLVRAGRWIRKRRTLVASMGVAAILLMAAGLGIAWWQMRLAEERHFEEARNREQIDTLLDRCEAAIAADDTMGAKLAIGDAEQRTRNKPNGGLNDRLSRCRSATDSLVELDRIEELRLSERADSVVVREWSELFGKLGIISGQTSPETAAAIVNGSLARERLLTALELWLIHAPEKDCVPLTSLLAAIDPNPFRDAVRTAIGRSDWGAVTALMEREEVKNQPARFTIALGSIDELPFDCKIRLLNFTVHDKPRAFFVLMTAGHLYASSDSKTVAERLTWYRAAVAVRPHSVQARLCLGIALKDSGDLDGAIEEYRAAVAIDPKSWLAHYNLGTGYHARNDLDLAIAEYQAAMALNPNDTEPHLNLGVIFRARGNLDEAIREYREVLALKPKHASAHNNLGNALRDKGDLDGAIASYREAINLNVKDDSIRDRLAKVEQWRSMLPRLDELAAGKDEPSSSAEAIDFFELSRQPFLKRHAASARLYMCACKFDEKFASDFSSFDRRDRAARSAAIAGCGTAADSPVEVSARAALRQQALEWLNTNLNLLSSGLDSASTDDRKFVVEKLSAWRAEKELEGVRPDARRDGWSAAEISAWDGFWSKVSSMLKSLNNNSSSSTKK